MPVFIKDENKRSERLNIARYNNTQRQIKDIDLLSINANLRDVQEYLLIKSIEKNFLDDCFYLQIISSGKRDSNQTIKSLFEKNNIIKLTDFIRIYWVTYNNTLLGSWKNNISIMIRNEIIDKNYCFELSKSEKICKNISVYYNFLKNCPKEIKGDYQVSDVVFMYLLNKNNINQIVKIVDYINTNIFNEVKPSKLIDLYKSNNISKYIEKAKTKLNID